jgi:hypothetical protein
MILKVVVGYLTKVVTTEATIMAIIHAILNFPFSLFAINSAPRKISDEIFGWRLGSSTSMASGVRYLPLLGGFFNYASLLSLSIVWLATSRFICLLLPSCPLTICQAVSLSRIHSSAGIARTSSKLPNAQATTQRT